MTRRSIDLHHLPQWTPEGRPEGLRPGAGAVRARDKADPTHAVTLGNYAVFLEGRKDYDRAQEVYERAIKADPTEAITLGNYAGLLLATGDESNGLPLLARAFTHSPQDMPYPLDVELWFYAFAHRPEPQRTEALKQLKHLIVNGSRA